MKHAPDILPMIIFSTSTKAMSNLTSGDSPFQRPPKEMTSLHVRHKINQLPQQKNTHIQRNNKQTPVHAGNPRHPTPPQHWRSIDHVRTCKRELSCAASTMCPQAKNVIIPPISVPYEYTPPATDRGESLRIPHKMRLNPSILMVNLCGMWPTAPEFLVFSKQNAPKTTRFFSLLNWLSGPPQPTGRCESPRLCGLDPLAIHRKLMMCNVGFSFPPVKVWFFGEKTGGGGYFWVISLKAISRFQGKKWFKWNIFQLDWSDLDINWPCQNRYQFFGFTDSSHYQFPLVTPYLPFNDLSSFMIKIQIA